MTNLKWEIENNMCAVGEVGLEVSGEGMPTKLTPKEYSFMEVRVVDENGNTTNEKFFEGRLPNIGEPVELIYVGSRPDGTMRLQLRVREEMNNDVRRTKP